MMNSQFEELLKLIDGEVRQTDFGSSPAELYDPIRYIMDLGGKRLRPLLTLLSYRLFSDDLGPALPAAVAIEIFHNFTLMHDDIMDEAPLRRGQATVHEKWNPDIAILSGDVMLVKAYEKMMESDSKHLKQILTAFNKCATEVCEGQQMDMNFESREAVSVDEYLEMIERKTAALLGFSLELGAILGNATPGESKALKNFGLNLGVGFQLKDDLLDVFGDQEKFGKRKGGDIVSNKKTFLLITALEKANGEAATELKAWLENEDADESKKVAAVTEIYNQLGIKEATEQKADHYFQTAFTSLENAAFDQQKVKPLIQFAEVLINREH